MAAGFLLLLLVINPAHGETNLDAGWKACIDAASSVLSYDDFDHADFWLDYTWNSELSVQCHQIQAMKKSEARAVRDAELKRWQDEQRANITAKTKAAVPLVQRALADPSGNAQ